MNKVTEYEGKITIFTKDLKTITHDFDGARSNVTALISNILRDNPGVDNFQVVIREKA